MKNWIILSFLCFLALNIPGLPVKAESSVSVGMFQKWKLDESNHSLYFVSEENELILINTDTMTMDLRLKLEDTVYDMEVYNEFLYVAAGEEIKKINLSTKTVIETWPFRAFDIAVGNKTLFYATAQTYSSWDTVYAYEFESEKQTQLINNRTGSVVLSKTYRSPALTLDHETNELYIGESGGDGTDLFVFDALTFQVKELVKSEYMSGAPRHLLIDGNDLFFGASIFDKTNPSVMHGTVLFSSHGSLGVEDVKPNYIIGGGQIFDRNTYELVYKEDGKNVLLDSDNYLYEYDSSKKTISKKPFQPKHETDTVNISPHELTIGGGLTDWVQDKESGLIYAISEQNHKLYVIREADLKVIDEVFVGSLPIDIELSDNTFYIALRGATKTAVVPKANIKEVSYLLLDGAPVEIEVAGNRLFYSVPVNSHSDMRVYDLQTNEIARVGNNIFSWPTFKVDQMGNLLYVSETMTYSPEFHVYNLTTLELETNPTIQKYLMYSDSIQIINDDLFLGYSKVDRNDPAKIIEKYPINEHDRGHIVGKIGNILLTNRGIFRTEPFEQLYEFGSGSNLVYMNENSEVFAYLAEDQTLYKMSFGIEDLLDFYNLLPDIEKKFAGKSILDYAPADMYDHWAEAELTNFVAAGILSGYRDEEGIGWLMPENKITRAQFVKILVNSLGLTSSQAPKRFSDVRADDWYYDYVNIASGLGIVQGSSGKFLPNNNITREQIAAMVVRAFEKTLPFQSTENQVFKDVQKSRWSFEQINKAASLGIIKGYGDQFRPSNLATRAQAVVMIDRALRQEKTKMPSATTLTQAVRQFIDTENKWLQEGDYTKVGELYGNYSLGRAQTLGFASVDTHLNVPKSVQVLYNSSPHYETTIRFKSDRYAEVEVKNISYKLTITKDGQPVQAEETVDRTYYLQKASNEEWKIYDIEAILEEFEQTDNASY